MSTKKTQKLFRFQPDIVDRLARVAGKLGVSETQVITELLSYSDEVITALASQSKDANDKEAAFLNEQARSVGPDHPLYELCESLWNDGKLPRPKWAFNSPT